MKFGEIMLRGKTEWVIYEKLEDGKEIFRKRARCGGNAIYHYENYELVKAKVRGKVYGTWTSIKVVLKKGE